MPLNLIEANFDSSFVLPYQSVSSAGHCSIYGRVKFVSVTGFFLWCLSTLVYHEIEVNFYSYFHYRFLSSGFNKTCLYS